MLPGVGAFDATMKLLHNTGMFDVLNEQVLHKKKNILGVCVGMQVMAEASEEGSMRGFGWIPGVVKKIKVSGDVKPTVLKPLLETYIASIPTKNEAKEEWKDNSTPWISKKIDKDIYLKMEDAKSTVRISYKNDYKYSLKNSLIAKAVGDILKLRFTETLREQEGGTYGASAFARVTKRPKQEATITVGFDSNPDKVETLVAIVHKEIEKIAKGNIQQVDLEKTLANYLKDREQQKNYNRFDMSLLLNYVNEGFNMNDP